MKVPIFSAFHTGKRISFHRTARQTSYEPDIPRPQANPGVETRNKNDSTILAEGLFLVPVHSHLCPHRDFSGKLNITLRKPFVLTHEFACLAEQHTHPFLGRRAHGRSSCSVASSYGLSSHELITSSERWGPERLQLTLTLVLAESSIELVPYEIAGHPSVVAAARRKKTSPGRIILDQTYHHGAILKLPEHGIGRGRPDIVHSSLLLALASPLNMDGGLQCFVHTLDDHVITVQPNARLPKTSERFVSLLEQLYEKRRVPPLGPKLMILERLSLKDLLEKVGPDAVIALTTQGIKSTMEEIARMAARLEKPVTLVGGFSQGHFSRKTLQLASDKYRIDSRNLEASTVVSRMIYDYEKAIGLQRFRSEN